MLAGKPCQQKLSDGRRKRLRVRCFPLCFIILLGGQLLLPGCTSSEPDQRNWTNWDAIVYKLVYSAVCRLPENKAAKRFLPSEVAIATPTDKYFK
jgi:hypothetical protein